MKGSLSILAVLGVGIVLMVLARFVWRSPFFHVASEATTPAAVDNGWPAIVAFVLGFVAMVPFMNTSIVVGPVARALQGADLAFYVGFIVTGVLYYALRTAAERRSQASRAPDAASGACVKPLSSRDR